MPRLSRHLGRDIWIKRDDLTPLALGGNKARKLEYLGADALALGADVLVTAGAIQSNHVRQTAALAASQGLGCLALLENPLGTNEDNYLGNGNRLLLDLFGSEVEAVTNRITPMSCCRRRPSVCAALGANPTWCPSVAPMRLVRWAMYAPAWSWPSRCMARARILPPWPSRPAAPEPTAAWRWRWRMPGRAARWSGSRCRGHRRHSGPRSRGCCSAPPSCSASRFQGLQVELWDQYFAPRYGEPNAATLAAIRLLAEQEGVLLDPVYTGKAFAGLLDGWPGAPSRNGPAAVSAHRWCPGIVRLLSMGTGCITPYSFSVDSDAF